MRMSPSGPISANRLVDFGEDTIASHTTGIIAYSVPGAKVGQSVIVNPDSNGLGDLVIAYAYVHSPGQVNVCFYNWTGAGISPGGTGLLIQCIPVG